jgi:hypothetical protein
MRAMAADEDLTFADTLTRYKAGYILGRRLLLVSMLLLILSGLPLLYYVIIFFSGVGTALSAGAGIGSILQAFFAGIIFLFYGLVLLLISLLFRACAYILVAILDVAVNSSADLTQEQRYEIKEYFKCYV